MNKVEIERKNKITKIKINDQEIKCIGQYSITQNINENNGMPMLKIEMAIDEENSKITI